MIKVALFLIIVALVLAVVNEYRRERKAHSDRLDAALKSIYYSLGQFRAHQEILDTEIAQLKKQLDGKKSKKGKK